MLLSLAGISSVILGFVISIGLASVLGYPYTLVHAILPFLCLGIGIDDMFVIMQCLNNVKRSRAAAATSVPELMAETMAHAGVSITVTSVTDVVAFGVGYFTNMPGHVSPHHVSRVTVLAAGLQSFCIYASIGLGCIFVLQVTWLLAWLVLYCTVLYCTVLYCTVLYCRWTRWCWSPPSTTSRTRCGGAWPSPARARSGGWGGASCL